MAYWSGFKCHYSIVAVIIEKALCTVQLVWCEYGCVKQGQSLTHTVSPDEIQHVRSNSVVWCLPSDC